MDILFFGQYTETEQSSIQLTLLNPLYCKHPTYFSTEWFVLTFLKSGCVFSRDVSIKIFGLYFKYVKYLLLFVVVYNLWLLIF